MKYLKVEVNHRCGEDEFNQNIYLQCKNGKAKDIVHNFFKNFWGEEETEVDEKSSRYCRNDGCVVVDIDGWQEIPEKDFKIIEKYEMFHCVE